MTAWHIRQAVRLLKDGGIVAYPTESVYGLGCDPWNPIAVARLLQLKRRSLAKGLILIAADYEQFAPYLGAGGPALRAKICSRTARPTTWLVDAPLIPAWVRGDHAKAAVRIIRYEPAASLCRAFGGAIVSTSANVSGAAPARTALRVRRRFRDQLDYLVTGDVGSASAPSEIRDAVTDRVYRR